MLSRRALLTSSLWAAGAWAFGDASRFVPVAIKHGGLWDSRVTGLKRLSWELERRTSIQSVLEAKALAFDAPNLFEYPFVSITTENVMPALSAAEVEGLRRYVTYGGVVLAEAVDGVPNSPVEQSLRRELGRALPQSPLTELPHTHVLFKSFYLLENPIGRTINRPSVDVAMLNRRAAIIVSSNDVLGALARDEAGSWLYDCAPNGERQREMATRTAVNVVMYAMCLDYKDDAVHTNEILKRRR